MFAGAAAFFIVDPYVVIGILLLLLSAASSAAFAFSFAAAFFLRDLQCRGRPSLFDAVGLRRERNEGESAGDESRGV